jgi:hypothetical protein
MDGSGGRLGTLERHPAFRERSYRLKKWLSKAGNVRILGVLGWGGAVRVLR